MRLLVAVSGGVDSVALLDQLVRAHKYELVVAHFDHGIREDSAADARFVEALAGKYELPFVTRREELGAQASEERARTRRYAFLKEEAKNSGAIIVTAHHADDVIETIAINLIRGTGWRGLAVLDTQDILRPLLHATKDDLYVYALAHHLEWVEDSTNAGEKYLRNRVRRQINANVSKEQKQELLAKWQRQLAIKARITTELETHIKDGYYSRYFFTTVDDASAQEMLRTIIVAKTNQSPTRPQTERALLAIKTAARGAVFELGGGVSLRFGVRTFIVETS